MIFGVDFLRLSVALASDAGPHGRLGSHQQIDRRAPDGSAPASRCLGPGVAPHQADGVELGWFAGVELSALPRLVALVEQFDLLQFLERFAEHRLGVVELGLELVGRTLEVPRRAIAALA